MRSVNSTLSVAAIAAAAALGLFGCGNSGQEPGTGDAATTEPIPAGMVRGTVIETMDSGGYTYVLIGTGEEQRWLAGPLTDVAVGDTVQSSEGMPMHQFSSKTLNRTFELVYFVNEIANLSAPGMPAGHPTTPLTDTGDVKPAEVDTVVAELEPGKNIAWIHANKDELAGQQVSLRGKVVKYNANILGWNYLHIQDGSGDEADGSNDLTVTTKTESAVGDVVVATGTIGLDRDIGAGYFFPIMLEDAEIATE